MEINFLKYFTFRRFFNLFKVVFSFQLSKLVRKPVVWGVPVSFSIEPTNLCNYKCPECPSGTGLLRRPAGNMSLEEFKEIVDSVYKDAFYVQLFFQGEPYINKQLPEMIRYAQSKKLYVSVSTNGSLLSRVNEEELIEKAPDKLIFSMDGLDEETYEIYRVGGDFNTVDKNLKKIVEIKRKANSNKPFIELQFIVMKQNEHQIDRVNEYGKELGINKVALKTMQVYDYNSAVKFLPSNEKYRRYLIENKRIRIKNKLKNHCFALWRTGVITWDKKIVPCCFDKDADFLLGELNDLPFSRIWKSNEYQKFRKKILTNRKNIPMCNNCTEGLKMNFEDV